MSNYRELSKSNYTPPFGNSVTEEGLNVGSLQRIADACEAMSGNFLDLQRSVAFYKNKSESLEAENKRLGRVIAGLRGHIGRLERTIGGLRANKSWLVKGVVRK